jgi:hypothetical protein
MADWLRWMRSAMPDTDATPFERHYWIGELAQLW